MGQHIVEFCSTGPKCYSYLTSANVEVMHAKGFKVKNCGVDSLLNYASMIEIVRDCRKTIDMEENEISKNHNLCVQSKYCEEILTYVYENFVKRLFHCSLWILVIGEVD